MLLLLQVTLIGATPSDNRAHDHLPSSPLEPSSLAANWNISPHNLHRPQPHTYAHFHCQQFAARTCTVFDAFHEYTVEDAFVTADKNCPKQLTVCACLWVMTRGWRSMAKVKVKGRNAVGGTPSEGNSSLNRCKRYCWSPRIKSESKLTQYLYSYTYCDASSNFQRVL